MEAISIVVHTRALSGLANSTWGLLRLCHARSFWNRSVCRTRLGSVSVRPFASSDPGPWTNQITEITKCVLPAEVCGKCNPFGLACGLAPRVAHQVTQVGDLASSSTEVLLKSRALVRLRARLSALCPMLCDFWLQYTQCGSGIRLQMPKPR